MLQHKLKLFARDLSREQCLHVAVAVLTLLLDSSYILTPALLCWERRDGIANACPNTSFSCISVFLVG
jgi:hypothetical protein